MRVRERGVGRGERLERGDAPLVAGGAQRRRVLPDVGADVDDEVDVVGADQPGAALGRREAEARKP
jgi:hypothetical protein